jgi:hypothetical protein
MPNPGDHLRTPRTGYTHHGLYVGNGRVIHYAGMSSLGMKDGPIEETSLEAFAGGARVDIVSHPERRHARSESVTRAKSRLGEVQYGLSGNNCEHFVNWCIEGDHRSEQVDRAVPVASIGYSGSVGAGVAAAASTAAAGGVIAGVTGGAGIMSGLATVGAAVGGGAVAGIGAVAAAPALAAASVVNAALLPDGQHLAREERDARQAGRVATYTGAAVGTAGAIGAVAAAGTTGLSAAGITSGLAAIGATVGGGMTAGVAVAAAAPAALAVGAGYGVYKAYKWLWG